jgi:hypothetical protein
MRTRRRTRRTKRRKRTTWQRAAIGAGGTRATRVKLRAEKEHVPEREDHQRPVGSGSWL